MTTSRWPRNCLRRSRSESAAAGGRPTNSDLSYFNLEVPTGSGVIMAVGWPGQWSSLWSRDEELGLRVRAGQELTHFELLPGEEIRTPLVALQFWTEDWIRGQNVWRRWMLAHNVPRPNGKLPEPELFGCSSHLYGEMVDANEENQKRCIDRYLAEEIRIGHWWMDAGWYPCAPVGWPKTGTWEVDRQAVSGRLAGDQRLRPRQGRQDNRLVRARAGPRGHVADRESSRVGAGRGRRGPAEPRPARRLATVADRPRRSSC